MTPEEYKAGCLRTESLDFGSIGYRLQSPATIRLLHAAMGMSTEAGELLDNLKKHLFYGKPFDQINVLEELGDQCWYISVALDVLGVTWEEIWQANIEKLRNRYPEKFTGYEAIYRNTDAERSVLEENLNPQEKDSDYSL